MANRHLSWRKIKKIREMFDEEFIGYIASCCECSTDSVKKYGAMSNLEADVLVESLMTR